MMQGRLRYPETPSLGPPIRFPELGQAQQPAPNASTDEEGGTGELKRNAPTRQGSESEHKVLIVESLSVSPRETQESE